METLPWRGCMRENLKMDSPQEMGDWWWWMVDKRAAPANFCILKLTLIIFPPGFQSGWCQKKGNYRIDHFWLWKKEEKSHHHSTSCLILPLPPLSELDQAVLTKDIEHWSGGGALLFLVQLLLFLSREDLHVWVFSSDLIWVFFPPTSLGARFSFPGKKDETVGGWVALRGGGGGASASWQL